MRVMIGLLVLAWLCCPPAALAAWTEVQTPHYIFLGDASRRDMRRIAQRFEQFHAVMQQMLSRASLSFSAPTIVLVFRNEHSFRPYMPRYQGKPVYVAGLALARSDLNYVALHAEGGEAVYPVVFHELTHLITNNVSQISATWFREAIAEYYSSFEMRGDDEVLLGSPIWRHTHLLQEQFMPLRKLLEVDETSSIYNESDRATVFYAESWALLHYLRFNQTTRERLGEFIRLAEEGVGHELAIRQAFGLELPDLERALREYVRKFQMLAERVLLPAPVTDSSLSASEVPEEVVLPHLAGLLLRLDRADEAERLLLGGLQKSPRSASLHAAMAQLRLEQDRPAEALQLLQQDLDYEGFMDHFLVASVLDRMLSSAGAEQAAAKSIFQHRATAAVAARSDVPEAWRLVAVAHLLNNDVGPADAAIRRAVALAPANHAFRFTEVEVSVRRREFARARSILGAMMSHGRSAEIRAEARRLMGRLVQYELAASPDASRPPADPIGRSDPTAAPGDPRPPAPLPLLRDPAAGETRVLGTLVAIECGPGRVTLVVQAEAGVLRVSAPAFERIDFVSFRPDLQGEVRCAPRVPPDPVAVTWPGPAGATGEIRSESITVEFIPFGYKPK